jgi:VanZ family protein
MLAIFTVSHQPGESIDLPDIDWIDKILHAVAFGFLSLSFYFAFSANGISQAMLFSFLSSSIYGILDETHQLFVPGRSFELLDWVADMTGALLFLAILLVLKKILLRTA